MRRRRSTRSVIKLFAAAAVATASIVGLVRLSTPPAELPLCEDIEEIDTKVLTQPPRPGNAPKQLHDFLNTYINEHRPRDGDDDDDDEKEPGAVGGAVAEVVHARGALALIRRGGGAVRKTEGCAVGALLASLLTGNCCGRPRPR